MASKETVPRHLDPWYLALLRGICPSTLKICPSLERLRYEREALSNSATAKLGKDINPDSMNEGQQKAWDEHIVVANEQAERVQRVLGGNCRNVCILKTTKEEEQ